MPAYSKYVRYNNITSHTSKMGRSTVTKKSKGDIFWETWDHFWKQTSIAGVSNAGKATHPFRRTVWLLIFTIFLGLPIIGSRIWGPIKQTNKQTNKYTWMLKDKSIFRFHLVHFLRIKIANLVSYLLACNLR